MAVVRQYVIVETVDYNVLSR